jgi:hypothetical protein
LDTEAFYNDIITNTTTRSSDMAMERTSTKEPPSATGAERMQSVKRDRFASLKWPGERSVIDELLRWLARSLAVLALISGVALLLLDLTPPLTALEHYIAEASPRPLAVIGHAPMSALPLLFAGASYLALQAMLRPHFSELLKRLMLGAAFLLWGIVQLLRSGPLATDLGDLVIVLYVLDLGLIIWADLKKRRPRAEST